MDPDHDLRKRPKNHISVFKIPAYNSRTTMSQVRDLFFDEFYEELENVVKGIEGTHLNPSTTHKSDTI